MCPKSHADFTEPLNLLVTPNMKDMLIAVSFYRGKRGKFGATSKDMIQAGLDKFLASLGPADRKRFDEILGNVKIKNSYLKQTDE